LSGRSPGSFFDGARSNPTFANCDAAAAAGTAIGADAVLAIGGGSALDTAKTAAVLLKHPGKRAVDFYEKGAPIKDAAPLVAINTVHGTGSECDSFAMAQSDGEGKPAIRSPHLYPAYTIEDPALTVTLPVKHTVFTSVDALCHAVEAATAVTASPYCISLAKEAVRLTSIWLPTAIAQPGNLAARYWLMYASAIAGISFDLGMLHVTHALEHSMSALNAAITHGEGLGILCRPSCGKSIRPRPRFWPACWPPSLRIWSGCPARPKPPWASSGIGWPPLANPPTWAPTLPGPTCRL